MQLDIGIKIKALRTEKQLTQEDLAVLIGVSRQTLSKWENGHSYPDIGSVVLLTDVFNISLTELLKGSSVDEAQKIKKLKFKKIINQRNIFFISTTVLVCVTLLLFLNKIITPTEVNYSVLNENNEELVSKKEYMLKPRSDEEHKNKVYDLIKDDLREREESVDTFVPEEGYTN